MNRLPAPEERQWLTRALRTLIAKRGVQTLDAAPLVEPTNDWFPERWSTTATHGHRLAQRLLYYAGLGSLKPTLSAYEPVENEDGTKPWDAGTAGWFAGIDNGRAHFGLHVRQFSDPEAAAGVLAHEVAHAWRTHHHLCVDDREEEELLTDITTIVLGFGILSTNNTDRYRSSGTWSVTSWSFSSAGYLPAQAMAYGLALWCAARGNRDEPKIIERHLEPNQGAYFRAALEEIASMETPARDQIARGEPSRPTGVVRPESFAPYDPHDDEIDEPEYDAAEEVNRGRVVYRKPKGDTGTHVYIGALSGLLFGFVVGVIVFGESMMPVSLLSLACGAFAAMALALRSRRDVCSECAEPIGENTAVCTGCGGTVGRRVTERELRRIREEELDRAAAQTVDYEDCDRCEPERPCEEHQATERFGPPELLPDLEADETASYAPASPRSSGVAKKGLTAIAAMIVVATIAFAWWRQNHVAVYFDNVIERQRTIRIDGTTYPSSSRGPLRQDLKPGTHRIVLLDGTREIERFDAVIPKQSLFDALRAPRFFVYSAGAAGIYERATLVYSTVDTERTYESRLIALERWIEQEAADFVFQDAPLSVTSKKATRTQFNIAHGVGYREVAFEWLPRLGVEAAMRALNKGLDATPCNTDLRELVVGILDMNEQHDRAVAEARAWIGACDEDLLAHRAYQNLLIDDGRTEVLRAEYRKRLDEHANAANHYLFGRLIEGPAAMSEYREALRIDPELTWARVALGHEFLHAEHDEDAYAALDESLRATTVPPLTPVYYAMAAIATNRIEEALGRIGAETRLDADNAWQASWMLVRAKGDVDRAKVLLAEREHGETTTETMILRARLEWDSGAPRESILTDLRNHTETASAARIFALEDAMENGPDLYAAYTEHLGLNSTLTKSFSRALADAARGQLAESAILTRAAHEDPRMRAHALFALGVHAATRGDRASAAAYFRRAADRALDREFPYRVALSCAKRFGVR